MDNFNLQTWLLLFFTYCFLGWVWEVCFVSFKQRKWTNRGFLYGPFLPIYGFGAIIILLCTSKYSDNIVLLYFAGVFYATVLELIGGMIMVSLFKVRYWDYSHKKYQYKGYICLGSSIGWGFFSILLVNYVNVPIRNAIENLSYQASYILTISLMVIFTVDTTKSVQNALDLRKLLETMAANNHVLSTVSEHIENISERVSEGSEEMKESLVTFHESFRQYREQNFIKQANRDNLHNRISNVMNRLSDIFDDIENDVDLRDKFELHLSEFSNIKEKLFGDETSLKSIDLKDFKGAVKLLERNPSANSDKLKEEINEIKNIKSNK